MCTSPNSSWNNICLVQALSQRVRPFQLFYPSLGLLMSNASSPPLRGVVGMTLATSSASAYDFAFDKIFACLDDSGEEEEHGKNGSSTTPTTYDIVGAKSIAPHPMASWPAARLAQ